MFKILTSLQSVPFYVKMFKGEYSFQENQTASVFNVFLQFRADTTFTVRISCVCFCDSVKENLLSCSHLLPHTDEIKQFYSCTEKDHRET